MLPIYIAIIILSICVIILSIVCLRLNKRINTPVRYVDEDDISGLKADYAKLVNYLTAKQGVSCVDCIHRSVCDSNETMCKSNKFGLDFGNGTRLTIKPVGLCNKFIAEKDNAINGTAGPIE